MKKYGALNAPFVLIIKAVFGRMEKNKMKIKLLNKIAKIGIDNFDKKKYEVSEFIEDPDAIMVRSAVMHDMPFGKNLLAIARAGAGVNNIPVEKCTRNGMSNIAPT